MELWHFSFLEGGLKRPKIGELWTLNFTRGDYFAPAPSSVLDKTTSAKQQPRQRGEIIPPNLVQPISQYKLTFLHFGAGV